MTGEPLEGGRSSLKVGLGLIAGLASVAALAIAAPSASAGSHPGPCPSLCGQRGAPELLAVHQLRGRRVSVVVLAPNRAPLELIVARVLGGRLERTKPRTISRRPAVTLVGRFPVGDRVQTVAELRLRPLRAGPGPRTIRLRGGPGTYVLTADSDGRLGSSAIVRLERSGRLSYVLEPYTAPVLKTGRASKVAQSAARAAGRVDPYGQATDYYVSYRAADAPETQTAAGTVRKPRGIDARLVGLSFATTYHYRLVATTCSGCRWGTSYGAQRTFTTRGTNGLPVQQLDADRAISTYNSMQRYLYARNASGLYATNYPQSGNRYSFLWPFSRALAGTITLAGVPASLLDGASYGAAAAARLTGLSRYWDGTGYESDPPSPYGTGGDKYYDDAAWVGLATAQYYAISGNQAALADARNDFNFVYPSGWDGNPASPDPGGIYWVNQGVGVGASNHNRTMTSNGPNAELALLLGDADPASAPTYDSDASAIYGWVNQYLYNLPTSPNYSSAQPALMLDHVNDSGVVTRMLWTYNQGSMIAASVREYQLTGQPAYLDEAQAIASTALDTFTENTYIDQPAAFDAIFFRGLLVLDSVTSDTALKAQITQTIQSYADNAWNSYRGANGLFRFPSTQGSGDQLLDQGAMLQIYAMIAWSPGGYGKLP